MWFSKWGYNVLQVSSVAGWKNPVHISKAFHVAASNIFSSEDNCNLTILEIGAGTGLLGTLLRDLGYLNIDALDCSDEMLNKAKEKEIYQRFFVRFVDENKFDEIQDGEYDAVVCSGAISGPQIQARAFDEMVRWIKKGGMFCFSVRAVDMEDTAKGYKNKFQTLEDEKKWKFVSRESVDYYTNPGIFDSILQNSYACVYQKI